MKFRNIAGRGIFGESKVKGKLPMTGKYMAYVGSYSYTGKAKGITVYDVDVAAGKFIYRCEVDVDNSSYLKASRTDRSSTPSPMRVLWRSAFFRTEALPA